MKTLVNKWFKCWENGTYQDIPVTDTFRHYSPYGLIEGRTGYLDLVESNKDMFLENRIERLDELYENDRSCIRYRIINPDFEMEVSEWIYAEDGLIAEIHAYYHVGEEISGKRRLKGL